MAKPRAKTRPAASKNRTTRPRSEGRARRGHAVPARSAAAAGTAPASPQRRKTYVEAVALYEQGVHALQSHDFATAAALLRRVLSDYPEEKELNERVVQYISVCDRHAAAPAPAVPQTVEERLYAATLAVNSGDYEAALAMVDLALAREPDNDYAHFMRAVVLTLRGELAEALPSLVRSIELNSDNHALARQEPDLEALRRNEEARQALDALAPGPKSTRRRSGSRNRSTR